MAKHTRRCWPHWPTRACGHARATAGRAGRLCGPHPVYRRLVKMALDDLTLLETQIHQLDQEIAALLRASQDAIGPLAEVPGLGVDLAQQIIAEVAPARPPFPPQGISPPGSGPAPAPKRPATTTRAPGPPRATGK
jgi:hypothetical protein